MAASSSRSAVAADNQKRTTPRMATYTACELRAMELPEVAWIVDQIVSVGLWVLAGPPKVGKSFFVLDLLRALSLGGNALGSIPVTKMPVLYLALEDNRRRMRSRLRHLNLEDADWSDTFHFAHEAPRLDNGLLREIEGFLERNPNCRIVAIDTLSRVRGGASRTDDRYMLDYRVTEMLQELALRRDIAVLLVHHVRKAPGADIFETISGSYGLTGPADGILVLQRARGEATATLHITGRDVEERELALSFLPSTSTWKLMGDAGIYAQSSERRTILDLLSARPGLTPKQIADATGLPHGSVKHLCTRLRDAGKVTSDELGRYYCVHPVHPIREEATQTIERGVNDRDVSRSPVHSAPVNGVNGVNAQSTDALARRATDLKLATVLAGNNEHRSTMGPARVEAEVTT